MKSSFLRIVILVLLLVFSFMIVSPVQAESNPVHLRVQSVCPTRLKALGTTINWVAEKLDKISGGNIKMKVYDPGKMVPPHEILDAVSKGKLSAGYTNAADWAGKLPASPLFGAVPFGPEPIEYTSWFYYGDGMELYQEMYDRAGFNVHVLLCGILPPETSGWSNRLIKKPEDLKGLKTRFLGLGGDVLEKCGASVQLLPMAETFPALEKGALGFAEICIPSVDREIGLYKIAKYNYFPGWHQPATTMELLINKDVWEELSDTQKLMFEIVTKAATLDELVYAESIQGKIIETNEQYGITNVTWSDELLSLFKEKWEEVIAEQCQKDEFFRKVWDNLSAFRDEYSNWSALGYLKR